MKKAGYRAFHGSVSRFLEVVQPSGFTFEDVVVEVGGELAEVVFAKSLVAGDSFTVHFAEAGRDFCHT